MNFQIQKYSALFGAILATAVTNTSGYHKKVMRERMFRSLYADQNTVFFRTQISSAVEERLEMLLFCCCSDLEYCMV